MRVRSILLAGSGTRSLASAPPKGSLGPRAKVASKRQLLTLLTLPKDYAYLRVDTEDNPSWLPSRITMNDKGLRYASCFVCQTRPVKQIDRLDDHRAKVGVWENAQLSSVSERSFDSNVHSRICRLRDKKSWISRMSRIVQCDSSDGEDDSRAFNATPYKLGIASAPRELDLRDCWVVRSCVANS